MSDYAPLRAKTGPTAQAAVDYWNELLSGPDGRAQAERVVELQHERKVTYAGSPISQVARPRFVEAAEQARWSELTNLVSSAGRKVITAMRADLDRFIEEIGDFDPLERELIFSPYGFEWPDVSARWDSFATGDKLSFVELNGGVPGGIHYEDALAGCYRDLPIFGSVAGRFSVSRTKTTDALWQAMLSAWRQWGGIGTPVVGITDWLADEEGTEAEFWLFRDWLEKRGITAIVADPREWELVEGRLTAQGVTVDLLDRRLLTTELLARPDDCRVLIEAFKANSVCVVDPFELGLLHRKAFFSLLTDPDHEIPFTRSEELAIEATIPWTRRMTERDTFLPGQAQGDLVEFVSANRDTLVLKPSNDEAGHGLHLGWIMTDGEWSTAIDQALASQYVVQERVQEVVESFPLVDPFGESRDFYLDTDPMVAGGRFGGTLSRLSEAEITNVAQGGSVVPTFLITP